MRNNKYKVISAILCLTMVLSSWQTIAQNILIDIYEVAAMPEPVTNNAVASKGSMVYSFGGIDSTKAASGIHQRCYRYNSVTDVWDSIPPLPDTLGKIASGASTIGDIVYILGGYHVFPGGSEVSSSRVHRYNTVSNTYLADGAPIPVPIDDHVQAVWRDSLIYVVTGWTTSGHTNDVQIYDAINDNWLTGTPVANNTIYRSFGASGSIVGDTIYYLGGAGPGFSFPAQNYLRKGAIDPNDPTQITWTHTTLDPDLTAYRAAAFSWDQYAFWVGGSKITYNFDGIAYNGAGGVSPSNRILQYPSLVASPVLAHPTGPLQLPMDLRGIGRIGIGDTWCIAGGMAEGQQVSDKTYTVTLTNDSLPWTSVDPKLNNEASIKIYPNPANNQTAVFLKKPSHLTVTNLTGSVVWQTKNAAGNYQIDVTAFPAGIYTVRIEQTETTTVKKLIIQH